MKRPAIAATVVTVLTALIAPAAYADNFSFEVGGHYITKGKSDIKDARKQDLSIYESSGTFTSDRPINNGEAKDKFQTTPWMGLTYRKDFGGLGFQFGAAYESYSGKYEFVSDAMPTLGSSASIFGTTGDITQKEKNRDVEVGLRIPLLDKTLHLTPRLGHRISDVEITGDEFTGGYSSSVSGSTRFNMTTLSSGKVSSAGSASGNYIGLNLDWNLAKFVDLYASYTNIPDLNGSLDMNSGGQATQFTIVMLSTNPASSLSGTGTGLVLPLYWKSGYKLNMSITDIGFKWKIGETFFIRTGYKTEATKSSFPGYAEYTAQVAQAGSTTLTSSDIVEPISNTLLYGKDHTRKWESFSLSAGANVDFGG